ncbi:MAG: hypothetical protein ACTSR8_15770 [Promethearchaeota archaeon]
MSKKIIFVGPPGTGKTSLRKVFFEGENSKRILNYSLKPTYGEESIILDIQEKIGIFDLAGQENDTWLQLTDDSIFIGSKIIIIVLSCIAPIETNIEFIKKVIDLRNSLSPDSLIYILIHKIDLISEREVNDMKLILQDRLYYYNHIHLAFTSIHKDFFPYTFSLFIDILRVCITAKVAIEKAEIDLVYNTVFFLFLIHHNNLISKAELIHQLQISSNDYERIESMLLAQDFITLKKVGPSMIYRLTKRGHSYINKLMINFSLDSLQLRENANFEGFVQPLDEDIKFIGFFIADKSGLPLLKVEIKDGYFERFLKSDETGVSIDTDLIIPLMSALEMFSSEINIKDLDGIKLKGSNIIVQSFNHRFATISLLANSDANIKAVEDYIKSWFDSFFNKHLELLKFSLKTGDRSELGALIMEGKKFLYELNTKYNELINNHDIYDISEIKTLYNILDKLPLDTFSEKELKVVQTLKRELIKSSIEEDVSNLKKLSDVIKKLNS